MRWCEQELKPNVRAVSYPAREAAARKHIAASEIGEKGLHELTTDDVRAWLSQMREAGCGPAVTSRAFGLLKRALRHAVEDGVLEVNPADGVKKPRYEPKETPHLRPADVWRYLEAVRGDPYEALFVVMATSGLRPSELLALTWSDVEEGTVLVDASVSALPGGKHEVEAPKTAAGKRRVPLAREAVVVLSEHRKAYLKRAFSEGRAHSPHSLVFGTVENPDHYYSRYALYHRWTAALARAGLPRVPLYALRHTATMLYAAAGADLKTTQGVMGHADARTTLKTYLHFVEERAREAAKNVDGLLGPREKDAK